MTSTTSTTTWTAGSSSGRWRHRAAVTAVASAIAVAGGAVASASGAVPWPSAGPSAPAPADPVTGGPSEPGVPAGGQAEPNEPAPNEPAPNEPGPNEPEPSEPEPSEPEPSGPAVDESSPEPEAPSEPALDEDDGGEAALTTAEVQERLRQSRFLIGAADGEPGQQTTAAIMAFQRVNGLGVDGVVGPATTAALLEGSAEPVLAGGPADRIEVDLDRQLLHLVEEGQRIVTMQVSSGNGETYTSGNGTAQARTPVGTFVIERRIHGIRQAPLGTLYDPLYFHRGFAIHGSPSVPAYPASHGCVRVSMADAAWLIQRVPDGTPVHLYGGPHVFRP